MSMNGSRRQASRVVGHLRIAVLSGLWIPQHPASQMLVCSIFWREVNVYIR